MLDRALLLGADAKRLFAAIASRETHASLLADGKCSRAASNPECNRYCDCWPVDSHLCDVGEAGYLNASLLQLGGAHNYIAAAGPMAPEWHGPDTRGAFWSAVLKHKVPVLVALAPPQHGFQGCADYCVDGATYDGVRVEILRRAEALNGTALEEHIRVHRGCEGHSLVRILFREWPNYGVPEAATSVAGLITRIDELRPEGDAAPLLVHCAGGVGRTGSLIVAHSLWAASRAAAQPIGPDDVCARVKLLRAQRHPYCVESAQQLQLIFDVLLELDHAARV